MRRTLGSFGAGGTGRGLVDRIYQPGGHSGAARFCHRPMKVHCTLTGAAQTGVFSTFWKFFPSCLFLLAVQHGVPTHREDMEGNRPPHLSHFL